MRGALFFLAVLALSGLLLSLLLGKGRRLWRRAPEGEWERLLQQLNLTNRFPLPEYPLAPAQDQEQEQGEAEAYPESLDLWTAIGGLRGLEQMEANCDVLIALACEVQQRYPDALVVAERLRLDARQLKWHVERLKGAEKLGKLTVAFPDYAHRAVATYREMTFRVLDLYQLVDPARYLELKQVLS